MHELFWNVTLAEVTDVTTEVTETNVWLSLCFTWMPVVLVLAGTFVAVRRIFAQQLEQIDRSAQRQEQLLQQTDQMIDLLKQINEKLDRPS